MVSAARLKPALRAVLLGVTLASLAGCSIFEGKDDATNNANKDAAAYRERSVEAIYADGWRAINAGAWDVCAAQFNEVDRQHPYSIWARRAQLMSAFNYYMARKYTDAVSSAQRFVTIHPGNAEAPYAHYLIAMSYYQQIEDVTRDQGITQQASDAFGELIRRYPQSRYAADARLKLDLIRDHLAGKEMEVGRFYQRSGNWLAASLRFREVVEKYQTTSHAPEALERMVECYLALGVPDEARKAAAVLGRNYPNTYWYRQSLRLMLKHYPGATPVRAEAPAQPAPTGQ